MNEFLFASSLILIGVGIGVLGGIAYGVKRAAPNAWRDIAALERDLERTAYALERGVEPRLIARNIRRQLGQEAA